MISTTIKSTIAIKESAKDTMTVQYINPEENRILKLSLLTIKGNIKETTRVKEQRIMSALVRTFSALSNLFIKAPPFSFIIVKQLKKVKQQNVAKVLF